MLPDAPVYFANDIAVDDEGNAYVTDWYAKAVYKVDINGNASLLWRNDFSKVKGGANGIDYHKDGYLIVSLLNVNEKWLYDDYALIKIPLDNPKNVQYIDIKGDQFSGFDGMVIKDNGNIVGVTNNQKSPGGNMLIELSSDDNYKSATIIKAKAITPSTTVAITPDNANYVIEQDFTNNFKKDWIIKKVAF